METKSKLSNQKLIIILLVALIALLAIVLVVVLGRGKAEDIPDGNTPLIGYSTEAKVMLDQDSLQAAFDEALKNAEDGFVGLKYQNDAYSTNGTDFECYIANSESNVYDMFLTIYADAELSDQIFLSGLVPPGSGFENITLDHALDPGDHTVFVALTQVDTDEETGEQTIKNQAMHTIEFHVTK
jgi:hypothetical protein